MTTTNKIIYWTATVLLSFGMLGSAFAQLTDVKEMTAMITHLGYPLYFMKIIGVWKILGVVVILIPGFGLMKEWAYAGFFFLLTGAFISHLVMGDGGKDIMGSAFQTVFVVTSWYFRPAERKIVA
jgi:VIT1/CCC1 family predicted Fe2+/Mn2+ transporter